MDRQTDGEKDRQRDGHTDRQADEDRQTDNGQTYRQTDRQWTDK